jgi:hypothetical protein
MKLVLTLAVDDDAERVDAQIAYHLNAGVDLVLAGPAPSARVAEILESYAHDGRLRVRPELTDARAAAREEGADWVLASEPGEFWWPRAENLKEVLRPIPPRYTIVQALVRDFLARPGDGFFADRMTVRRSLQSPDAASAPADALRRAHRVHEGSTDVPLRAWYPFEVLRFPSTAADTDDEAIARGLSDRSLATDTRLRDALAELRTASRSDVGRLRLPVPDIVDDAAYAVECAAVGEVDMASLERHIDELEARIAWLEQRFWPRVLRRLTRIGRRSTI